MAGGAIPQRPVVAPQRLRHDAVPPRVEQRDGGEVRRTSDARRVQRRHRGPVLLQRVVHAQLAAGDRVGQRVHLRLAQHAQLANDRIECALLGERLEGAGCQVAEPGEVAGAGSHLGREEGVRPRRPLARLDEQRRGRGDVRLLHPPLDRAAPARLRPAVGLRRPQRADALARKPRARVGHRRRVAVAARVPPAPRELEGGKHVCAVAQQGAGAGEWRHRPEVQRRDPVRRVEHEVAHATVDQLGHRGELVDLDRLEFATGQRLRDSVSRVAPGAIALEEQRALLQAGGAGAGQRRVAARRGGGVGVGPRLEEELEDLVALLIGRGAFSFGVHGRRNSVHHRACGVAGRLRVDAVVEVGTRLDEHAHTADVAVLHGQQQRRPAARLDLVRVRARGGERSRAALVPFLAGDVQRVGSVLPRVRDVCAMLQHLLEQPEPAGQGSFVERLADGERRDGLLDVGLQAVGGESQQLGDRCPLVVDHLLGPPTVGRLRGSPGDQVLIQRVCSGDQVAEYRVSVAQSGVRTARDQKSRDFRLSALARLQQRVPYAVRPARQVDSCAAIDQQANNLDGAVLRCETKRMAGVVGHIGVWADAAVEADPCGGDVLRQDRLLQLRSVDEARSGCGARGARSV
mmetsp:Transcript_21260/g.69642  ORF Transcript_21260/g.69642 Transcript_21260/m.69642 type:complete len:631 (-) Transcript_21260:25-1917(-)